MFSWQFTQVNHHKMCGSKSPALRTPSTLFYWLDRTMFNPRSRLARSPSRKRRRTFSVAVRLCTCRFTRIHLFTLSSSIHVAWILQFNFDRLTSKVRWCQRWYFGRSLKRIVFPLQLWQPKLHSLQCSTSQGPIGSVPPALSETYRICSVGSASSRHSKGPQLHHTTEKQVFFSLRSSMVCK